MLKEGSSIRVKPIDWFNEFCYTLDLQDGNKRYVYGYDNALGLPFLTEMKYFCGKEVTIESIVGADFYKIKEDFGKFLWGEFMFDMIDSKILVDHRNLIRKYCNYQCVLDKCNSCPLLCVKIKNYGDIFDIGKSINPGDKVKIKSRYFLTNCNPEILYYSGKYVTIKNKYLEHSSSNRYIFELKEPKLSCHIFLFDIEDRLPDYINLAMNYCNNYCPLKNNCDKDECYLGLYKNK